MMKRDECTIENLSAVAAAAGKATLDDETLAAADAVAEEWGNHGKGAYFAEVYAAVDAKIRERWKRS